eukprot:TRINITY_DN12974_c0_g1_i1.p1 TRINITY_DN12974_c0_g1~~TRINITY_DN12974_c0_g1_i1.p1  ORF type:complete len:1753 (-),score=302.99 TRINITY_DN12974_c0_g1_i1:143-5401(-)
MGACQSYSRVPLIQDVQGQDNEGDHLDLEKAIEFELVPTWPQAFSKVSPLLGLLASLPESQRSDGAALDRVLKDTRVNSGDTASPLFRLMPSSSSNVVFEDASSRAGLRYDDLSTFIQRGIDFNSMHIGPGDRAAFVVPNGAEAAVLLLACLAHCTAVPLNPAGTQAELFMDAKMVGAKVLIVHQTYMQNSKQRQEMRDVAADLGVALYVLHADAVTVGKFSLVLSQAAKQPEPVRSLDSLNDYTDTALLLFTSGSTGGKKCVPYDLGTLLVGASCIVASWQLAPTDKVLNMMPLFHVGGIMRNVLSVVLSGGSGILCPAFDAVMFWNMVEKHRQAVTWYYAGPVMHQLILDEFDKRALKSYRFRFVANAAGGLLPVLAERMAATYKCTVLPGYGMTECMPISAPPLTYKLDRKGTSGVRVGPELKIFDDDGQEVASGSLGNIVVRGPPLFKGYENDEEATKAAFFAGGWFNTGDVGYMDEDGYLYITGRSKEVINRGGEIISPFEVEEAVQGHPNVKCVIAFSVPHEVLDETIGVAVVMREGAPQLSLKSVQAHCKKSLTFAKWPQVLVLMSDLPKNLTNKPLRIKLADRLGLKKFWGGAATDSLPEYQRTFFSGCPPKGASLKEPIPDVKMLLLDMLSLSHRVRDEAAGMGIQQAVFIQSGKEARLCLAVTPEAVDTKLVTKLLQGKWHDWELPEVATSFQELPRKLDGSVDDEKLGRLMEVVDPNYVAPETPTEEKLQRLWEEMLDKPRVSVEADFFDLGGSSLLAGPLATSMQDSFGVAFTALDMFTAPTVRSAAALIVQRGSTASTDARGKGSSYGPFYDLPRSDEAVFGNAHPFVLLVQLLPFCVVQPMRQVLQWIVFLHSFYWVDVLGAPRLAALVAGMVISRLVVQIVAPVVAISMKWLILGRLREGRYPLFGSTYLRWWLSNQILQIGGKGIFARHNAAYYRLLGATIGEGLKMSCAHDIKEPDVVTIGDDVSLDGCHVQPFALSNDRTFTVKAVRIGNDCSIGSKTLVAGGATLPDGTALGPLSSSHELQDATPGNELTNQLLREEPPLWICVLLGYPIVSLQRLLMYLPVLKLMERMMLEPWYLAKFRTIGAVFEYVSTPNRMPYYVSFLVILQVVSPWIALFYAILIKRIVIGRFEETAPEDKPSRSAWELLRPWLMQKLIPDPRLGGVTKMLGRHYELISCLYRLLGCKVGKYVYWPGSGMRFTEPDLVEIGDYVVFGSRSTVQTSDAHHRRRKVVLESGCNVSDRCFIAPGTTVCSGAVLGSGALTKADTTYSRGTYVGNKGNECVLLKKGLADEMDQTPHTAYAEAFERSAEMPYWVVPESLHVLWSTLIVAIRAVLVRTHLMVSLLAGHVLFHTVDETDILKPRHMAWMLLFLMGTHLALLIVVLLVDIGSKWLIMGRVLPGEYAWNKNNYSQRWQLYLSMAPMRFFISADRDYLSFFEGSQYLVWYFRAIGATIGKDVCLYPNGADPMMTEPDSVTIRDGAGIDAASLTAHLNTRGEFTINHIEVGEDCVMRSMTRLQQSARMEAKSVLLEHTLVLPADRVKPGEWRQGWPAGSGWVPQPPLAIIAMDESKNFVKDEFLSTSTEEDTDTARSSRQATPQAGTELEGMPLFAESGVKVHDVVEICQSTPTPRRDMCVFGGPKSCRNLSSVPTSAPVTGHQSPGHGDAGIQGASVPRVRSEDEPGLQEIQAVDLASQRAPLLGGYGLSAWPARALPKLSGGEMRGIQVRPADSEVRA